MKESEQHMLGLDTRTSALAGLVAGEEERPPRFLCVAFEHRRILALTPQPPSRRLWPPPLRACDPCPRAARWPSAAGGSERRGSLHATPGAPHPIRFSRR